MALQNGQSEHAVKLLTKHFLNRTDVVAFMAPWGHPCPADGGNLDAMLKAHVQGNASPVVPVKWRTQAGKSGTEKIRPRCGSYAPDHDGKTIYGCVDSDGGGHHGNPLADPVGTALQVEDSLNRLGLPNYLEMSGSAKGWHNWLLFGERVPASKVRKLLHLVAPRDALMADGITKADPKANLGIEVFPKADTISADGVGNMVFLPWFHGAEVGGNQFYRTAEDGELAAYLPDAFETATEAMLDLAIAELTRPKSSRGKATSSRPSAERLIDRAIKRSGHRNTNGHWLACQLRDNGYGKAEAKQAMLQYQQAVENAGDHPYRASEATASVESAFTRPAREPWGGSGQTGGFSDAGGVSGNSGTAQDKAKKGFSDSSDKPDESIGGKEAEWEKPLSLSEVPIAAPFPIEVFPQSIQHFPLEAAQSLGSQVDFLGLPMLAIAGGAIGASRALEIKAGFVQRPLLYAAIVARPGDTKSPSLDTVARPVYQAQEQMRVEFDKAVEQYKIDYQKWQEAKKANPGLTDPEPEEPTLRRIVVDDATVESLAPILLDNPRGVVMIKDELMAVVSSNNQYKGGKGSDRQFWLKNWSGAPVHIDRKKQDVPIIIPHPFVAVVGCIQPDLLADLREENGKQDGNMDRFLFSFPEQRDKPEWTWDELSEETVKPWREAVGELMNLNQVPTNTGMRPYFINLSKEAKGPWANLMNRIAKEMNQEGFPSFLRGPWSKLQVYAARLALIVHQLRWVTKEAADKDVDKESILRTDALITYFQSHARKVYAVMGSDREIEDAKRILAWIGREKRTEFKRWEAHKDLKNSEQFPRVEDLDQPLQRLVKHQYLRMRIPDKKPVGRPPEPVYDVNPLWNHRDNRVNRENAGASEKQG